MHVPISASMPRSHSPTRVRASRPIELDFCGEDKHSPILVLSHSLFRPGKWPVANGGYRAGVLVIECSTLPVQDALT